MEPASTTIAEIMDRRRRLDALPERERRILQLANLAVSAAMLAMGSGEGRFAVRHRAKYEAAMRELEDLLLDSKWTLEHKAFCVIAELGGNLPDDVLTDRTGPNDAAHRGLMYCQCREIARAALEGRLGELLRVDDETRTQRSG
jgi:hypothetical protein